MAKHAGKTAAIALLAGLAAAGPAGAASPEVAGRGATHSHTDGMFVEPETWNDIGNTDDYSAGRFIEHASAIPFELAAIGAGITILGIYGWDWGSSDFHFTSEGFFGEDTFNGGMDKLGHFYTTYVLTDFLTYRIENAFEDAAGADITAAILSSAFMAYVEVFDGLSYKHGFSGEDIVMNTGGALFSILLHRFPELDEKIDFRLQWLPSDDGDVWKDPATDYEGQKYVLAIKPAGFDALAETPLRFTEFHVGYYARGFKDERREERERNLYVGLGLNLAEIYKAVTNDDRSLPSRAIRTGFEYIQVPYTYVPVEHRF